VSHSQIQLLLPLAPAAIALAATEEQLKEEWLQNAVRGLVTAIQEIDMADVEKATMKSRPEVYGSLCHAARGSYLINMRWTCAS